MFYELSDTHELFLLAWEQQRNVLATLCLTYPVAKQREERESKS